MLVGAAVAIAAQWPAQFGGSGDPDDVAAEALTRGTALSPPLAPVIVFVVALVMSLRAGLLGKVGTVLLMLVTVVFIIGGLGEAFAPPTADVPRPVLVLSGLVGVVLRGLILVAATQRLRHGP